MTRQVGSRSGSIMTRQVGSGSEMDRSGSEMDSPGSEMDSSGSATLAYGEINRQINALKGITVHGI